MAKKRSDKQIIINQLQVGQLYRNKIDIQNWMNALRRAESILAPNRRSLYEIYNNVLIDGHLTSVMEKRIRAVKTAPINIEGTEDERLIDKFQTPWFYELLHQIMATRFWGHSVIEFVLEGGEIAKAKLIPRQNVIPEKGLITRTVFGSESDAWSYREEPLSAYMLEVGEDRDLGLLAKLAPYVIYKRHNIAEFAQFNELFGMPIREYMYDPHDPGSRAEVTKQAEEMGSAAYIVMPKGTEIQLHQVNHTGATGTYTDFNRIMNDEMSITVLGQTLTTGADGKGSYALGNVHKAVEEGINLEDKLWCEYVLNWDFKWILEQHGYPVRDVKFKFDDTQKLPLDKRADVYLKISQQWPIDAEFIYEEFNIPEPSEETKQRFEERRRMPVPIFNEEDPEKKKNLTYRQRMLKLYDGQNMPASAFGSDPIELAFKQDILKAFENAMQRAYDGSLKAGDIDEGVYQLIRDRLFKGVEKGFGQTLSTLDQLSPDYEMLKALQENVYVFSGAKTYHQLREMTDLLFDEKGIKRSFNEFRDLALKIHSNYNEAWLFTEYQMAIGNARMASQWSHIQATKDALPFLRFRAVKDGRSRHLKYDGIILPVDDPAWDWLMPLIDYGCRCTVSQLATGEVTTPDKLPDTTELKEEFRFNPGKDRVVFNSNHPYFDVPPGTKISPESDA